MRVWLVRDLEPLPTDPGGRRLMRMGMLAQALAREGTETRWFTSSFDHYLKRQRTGQDEDHRPEPNLAITVLAGPGYRRNVSVKRIAHNRAFAAAFSRFAQQTTERPDVIVTDIPTTEAADAAVAFGRAHSIPVIVSIRDLWPDFFPGVLPSPLRPLARLALAPLDRQARRACAGAAALVGISQNYLDWGLAKAGRTMGPNDRIIPLGYERQPLPDPGARETILSRFGVRPETALVAFVGSWGQTYDLELLADAAAILSDRPGIQFLIAGGGDREAALRGRFEALDNVLVPGWISAAEIAVVLDRARIGILPYRPGAPQGLPNKVFEYLAYGAYQIATIEGELKTLYAQTGAGRALAAPTARELAMAITAALADGEVVNGRAARVLTFEANWASHAVYADLAGLVRSLAGQGGNKAAVDK